MSIFPLLNRIKKNRSFYLTNLFCLTLGLTSFIMVFIFIKHEYSFDKYHKKSDRIYRIVHHLTYEGSGENSASCPYPVADLLKQNYPDLIDNYVRFFNNFGGSFLIKSENNTFLENKFVFVDTTFLKVFDFNVVNGNATTALDGPNKIIITKSAAKKYFGNENPLNKTLKINDEYIVNISAVIEDMPSYSHFNFDFFCSMPTLSNSENGGKYLNWYGNPFWTYIVLNKDYSESDLEAILPEFALKHAPGKNLHSFSSQLLTRIHLHSNLLYEIGSIRNINYIWLLISIGILVLLMSLINYINLSVSFIQSKLKEISIKKLIGISPHRLVIGLFSETLTLCLFSLVISVILVFYLSHKFGNLFYEDIMIENIINSKVILILIGVIIISTLISVIYPSYVLFVTKPLNIVRKNYSHTFSNIVNQKIFVVVQFLFSIFLVTGSIITIKQVNFLKDKSLGFKKENILILNIKNTAIAKNVYAFLDNLNNNPNIKNKTFMEFLFGYDYNTEKFYPEIDNTNNDLQLYTFNRVHEDFIKTFGIEIVQGRDFKKDYKSDYKEAVLINEAMVKHLGWSNESAIGKKFRFKDNEKVIGVFRDFHQYTLHSKIEPLIIDLVEPESWQFSWATNYVAININASNTKNTINFIENKWKEFAPDTPFNYHFLDTQINNLYKSEQKLSYIIRWFTAITILLACIGIFTLSIKMAKIKTKEIGIRKVNGAKATGILKQLHKEFVIWVIISLIISYPLSFIIMSKWLNNFAFKTNITWWIFILTGIITLLVSLITVSWQTLKAAKCNPVEALRYE